jgi:two-component system sensor kinase FixL
MTPSQQVCELANTVPGATTDELLHKLLADLTALLGARRGYVTEVIDCAKSRTIASWEDNQRGPVRTYAVSGTPCAAVLRHGVQVIDCDLSELFIFEESSLGYGCDSFVGSPIVDRSGERIGQLCIFGSKPLSDPDMAGALVSLAAMRVSAELEHRQQQTSLARSEAYSKAIVATAADGVITLDAKGRIESFNRAAEDMFGYKAKEVLGKDINVLMPERYQTAHTGYIARYTKTGEGSIFGKGRELPARRKDGSIFPIYLAASEISLNGDLCFAGIIRDISEQKAAEASLKATEQRFRAVFDQRLQLVRILSTDGIILEANQKSLDFSGLQRDSVIGCYLWDAPWWSHSPKLQQRLRDAIMSAAKGASVQFEATCPRPNGDMATVDFSLRPITDNTGEVVFLVAESHDITEQKMAEDEARHQRDRFAHVSRLSTLGEMAAGIAHEINQPLTAISLFAQAGTRLIEAGNFEKMKDVCHKLNEHSLRASDVVERMQTMARQGESIKETVDCNDLIESAVRLAESEARIYDIQIDFDKGNGLPTVSVDGVQIQQVTLNLLRNGMEAMMTTNCCREKSVAIRTRAREENEIEVAVTDCASGVPEEHVDKLFTPFSTTKKSGMGMGLSISQAIVRAHGGKIDFRNNETGGATFWFTLPAAKSETSDGQ